MLKRGAGGGGWLSIPTGGALDQRGRTRRWQVVNCIMGGTYLTT